MKFWIYSKSYRHKRLKTIAMSFLAVIIMIIILFLIPYTEKIDAYANIQPKLQWSLVQTDPGDFQEVLKGGDRVNIRSIKFREGSNQDRLDFDLANICKEGNIIRKGEAVAIVHSLGTKSTMQQLIDEQRITQADIALLKAGSRPEEIEVAQEEVDIAKHNYDSYQSDFYRAQAMNEGGLLANADFEKIANQYELYREELELAQKKLASVASGESIERIRVEEYKLAMLNSKIDILNSQLERDTIRTPITGTFIGSDSIDVLCTVAQMDSMKIEILIRESDIRYVHPDAAIQIRPCALPESKYFGRVSYIKTNPKLVFNRSYFIAVTYVENPGELLKPDTFAYVKIYGKQMCIYDFIISRIKHSLFAQYGI